MRSEQEVRELLAYYQQILIKAQAAHLQSHGAEAKQHIYQDVLSLDLATVILHYTLGETDNIGSAALHKKYSVELKVLTIPPRKH